MKKEEMVSKKKYKTKIVIAVIIIAIEFLIIIVQQNTINNERDDYVNMLNQATETFNQSFEAITLLQTKYCGSLRLLNASYNYINSLENYLPTNSGYTQKPDYIIAELYQCQIYERNIQK